MTASVTQTKFVLPEGSGLGLRDQICEMVSAAIHSKALSPDKRLPSCREMAEQLGVSRNTVFAAYGRLIDLGLVVARDRSGYFVNPLVQENSVSESNDSTNAEEASQSPVQFESLGLVPVDNPLNWTSYPYPFIYNQIDPDFCLIDQ